MEQKSKRIFGKFNIVDVLAVLLIVAVLVFVGYKLATRGGVEAGEAKTVTVDYTVKCEGVDKSLYESCQKHLPSQLMASGELYDGQINSVREEEYDVLDNNGDWVKDPNHVTLYFGIEASIPEADVMTTEIAKQEVRVGKSDYILKSEYIEFSDCIITEVNWSK